MRVAKGLRPPLAHLRGRVFLSFSQLGGWWEGCVRLCPVLVPVSPVCCLTETGRGSQGRAALITSNKK